MRPSARVAPQTKALNITCTPASAHSELRTSLTASGSNTTKTPRWRCGPVTAPSRRNPCITSSATPFTAWRGSSPSVYSPQ